MDASRISSVKSQKKCRGITTALASAVLEWFLICLLFVEAIFSYLITKFAGCYELQTPCLLCSRLDHILGNEKLKYYYDLICRKHKLEISSLVLCHAHDRLVDVHGMCENCLLSFATINKSSAEIYRLLVGKLGEDSGFGSSKDPVVEDCFSSTQQCSCCNEPWVQNLMHVDRVGSEAAEFDARLPGATVYYQDELNKVEQSMPGRVAHHRSNSEFDHLPHVAYTELKVDSDTESEVLFSDDDINAKAQSQAVNPEEDVTVRCVQTEPRIITAHDDLASGKLIDSVTAFQTPVSTSQMQSDTDKVDGVKSVSPTVTMGNSLEELRLQPADGKSDISAIPDFISLDEIPQSSMTKETPVEVPKVSEHNSLDDEIPEEASKVIQLIPAEDIPPSSFARKTAPEEASEMRELISGEDILSSSDGRGKPGLISTESKLVSFDNVLPSPREVETLIQGLQESSNARTEDIWQTDTTDEEICKRGTRSAATNETLVETNPRSGDSGQQATNFLELGDAYKLAVGNKGRQLSGELAEQWIGKDSSRLGDDLKILFSQLSATREQTINDVTSPKVPVSPKLSGNGDELKNLDGSSSIGMQMLQKRISLERNESGLSLDGSMVSEIEGESAFDRLKRQIEHDKKLLNALFKELEEERNASAISANQALAMITRLQEEKATLQMEALQYLRMMEEQAEYDMEALEKTNDLLSQREKEIQTLEGELQFYRNKPSEAEPSWGDSKQVSDIKTEVIKEELPEATSVRISTLRDDNAEKLDTCREIEGRTMSLLDFDDERAYILQSLKKLEKRLSPLSDNHIDLVNGEYSENNEAKKNDGLSTEKDGRNSSSEDQALSLKKSELASNYDGPSFPRPPGGIDLDAVANEVSNLNERLKALEADRCFLEHCINSMGNGEEGLKFIQDIASHLKELRRIGIKEKEQTIA